MGGGKGGRGDSLGNLPQLVFVNQGHGEGFDFGELRLNQTVLGPSADVLEEHLIGDRGGEVEGKEEGVVVGPNAGPCSQADIVCAPEDVSSGLLVEAEIVVEFQLGGDVVGGRDGEVISVGRS